MVEDIVEGLFHRFKRNGLAAVEHISAVEELIAGLTRNRVQYVFHFFMSDIYGHASVIGCSSAKKWNAKWRKTLPASTARPASLSAAKPNRDS